MKIKVTKCILGLSLLAFSCPYISAAIPSGYTLTPGNNATVEKIETITLTKSNEYYLETYVNRNIMVNGEAVPIDQKANPAGTMITMTLKTPVTKSGTYNLVIPKGNFTYGYSEIDNPEISWTVNVDNPDQPDIPSEVSFTLNPQSGATLGSLDKVTIDFTGATAVSVNPDVAGSKVTLNGKEQETTLSYAKGSSDSQIVVSLSTSVATSGSCTMTLPEGLFSVTLGGEVKTSPEIKATYTLDAPLGVGEKFYDGKIRYIVLSTNPPQVAVTWPDNEADYARLSTIPLKAAYNGINYDVTEIGRLAFSEVKGISNFTVPEGITKIDYGAFWDSSLQSISIPSSVTELSESAFESCESLLTLTIPATVKTIGESLLYGCVSLTSLSLPEGMTEIPGYFMQGCAMMSRLDLPQSITKIGEFAFAECEILTDIVLPPNLTTLDRFCFGYCINLTKLEVPETVTEIGHGVFYQAGLTEASLPDNFTVLPDGMYQCCASLPSFVIGNKVEEIEQEAFYWCFALKEITFGEKVAKIGSKAFYGDTAIEKVVCLNPQPAAGAVFEDAVYNTATLIVPEGSIEAYRKAEGWKNFNNIQQAAGVESGIITDEAEVKYYNLQGVEIEQPQKGIFIKVQGGKITKVVK